MEGRMRFVYLAAVVLVAGLAAGCGNNDSQPTSSAGSASSSTPTSVQQQIESTITTPRSSAVQSSAATTTSTGVPVIRSGKQSLTLADAQETTGWREGSFDVPKVADPVQGIATEVGCYSTRELEFRFSLQSGVLNVGVAQSLDSSNSSVTLQFSLLADSRSVDVKKIAFDQQAMLSTQLDGVSVVKVLVDRVDGAGSCSETTALLTSVETA